MQSLVFIPGSAVPSRELLATFGLFAFSRHMVEVSLPHGDGWVCSRECIDFQPDAWDWTSHDAGYWIGTHHGVDAGTNTAADDLRVTSPPERSTGDAGGLQDGSPASG